MTVYVLSPSFRIYFNLRVHFHVFGIFAKRKKFCDFPLDDDFPVDDEACPKIGLLPYKRICSQRSNFFSVRDDAGSRDRAMTLDRVTFSAVASYWFSLY